MKSQSFAKKHRASYWALLALLAWILAPVFVKSILYHGMELFHAPELTVAGTVGELQDYAALRLHSKNRLIDANRRLSRELARARLEQGQSHATRHYLNRLERLLSLEPVVDFRSEYARIVRREVSAWFEGFVLDKGHRHGVTPGLAVVSGDGLVGRVSEVSEGHCRVLLVSSPSFRVTVHTANDVRPIAFTGAGQRAWDSLEGKVQHVPQDVVADAQQRRPLYTSGLGDGLPEGLYLGDLVSVEPEMEGLFQRGEVQLPGSLRSLREVAILIPLEQRN